MNNDNENLKQCEAQGCQRMVRRGLLMCGQHWVLLPAAHKRAVWAAWNAWRQSSGAERALTLRCYLAAKAGAIEALADKLALQAQGRTGLFDMDGCAAPSQHEQQDDDGDSTTEQSRPKA